MCVQPVMLPLPAASETADRTIAVLAECLQQAMNAYNETGFTSPTHRHEA
jgi:hypothetical protein